MKIMLSVILALYNKFFAEEYSVALIGSHEKMLTGESYAELPDEKFQKPHLGSKSLIGTFAVGGADIKTIGRAHDFL